MRSTGCGFHSVVTVLRKGVSNSVLNGALLCIACLVAVNARVSCADDELLERELKLQLYATMSKPRGVALPAAGASDQELINYWYSGIYGREVTRLLTQGLDGVEVNDLDDAEVVAETVFDRMCRADDFGKFRISLDVYDFLDPTWRLVQGHYDRPIGPDTTLRAFELRSLFAERQVRHWLKDPESLEQSVWFAAWYHRLKEGQPIPWIPIPGNVRRDFGSYSRDATRASPYWINARQALFLIAITNRSDMLRDDVTPEQIHGVFEKWFEWYREDDRYVRLRPSSIAPIWVDDLKADEDSTRRPLSTVPGTELKYAPQTPLPAWGDLPPALPPWVFREFQ